MANAAPRGNDVVKIHMVTPFRKKTKLILYNLTEKPPESKFPAGNFREIRANRGIRCYI